MPQKFRRLSAVADRLAGAFILLAFLAVASGFSGGSAGGKTVEDFSIHPLSGQTVQELVVANPLGPVEVAYEEQAQPEIRIQKTGRGVQAALTQRSLDSVKVEVSEEEGVLRIATRPSRTPGWWFSATVRLKVVLPNPSLQNISLNVSKGEITIQGIRVRDQVTASTGNGEIDVLNAAGKFDLATSDGKILLENVDLRPGSRIVSSRGAISGRLRIWAPGSYHLETLRGDIVVTLTDLTSVKIEASASRGNFRIKDLPGLVIDEMGHNRVRAHIGTGEVQLNLNSKDGDIAISK